MGSSAPGTVWYDLGSLGVQSLVMPSGTISLPDQGGGAVEDVHLSIGLCEPLSVAASVVNVPACGEVEVREFEARVSGGGDGGADGGTSAAGSATTMPTTGDDARPIGILATSRNGACILASLGSMHTIDRQLIDPSVRIRPACTQPTPS